MKLKMLNLGCGSFVHDDWINVDFKSSLRNVISCNLLNGVPFPDNEFDVVYHSHVLEHFPKQNALTFLKECFRVLKPGGVMRVVVPDLESIVREYLKWMTNSLNNNHEAEANYEWIMLEMYDQVVRDVTGGEMAIYLKEQAALNEQYVIERIGSDVQQSLRCSESNTIAISKYIIKFISLKMKSILRLIFGRHYEYYTIGKFRRSGEVHQWMYDRYSLSKLLNGAGFTSIEQKTALESNIPDFKLYGFDLYQGKPRGSNSLILEAFKPLTIQT